MVCHDLLSALNDYLDGETESAICRELQEHLAGCTTCRIVVTNLRHTITVYRTGDPMPKGLHERIHSILRERWKARMQP